MTAKEMEAVAGAIVDVIKQALDTRCRPLEERLGALEARPELKHCGVFKDQSAYEPGSLVTRTGGLWLATAKTAGAPGAIRPGV